MNRTEKTELSVSLKEKFNKASVALFADYKGLSSTQADDLRKKIRDTNGEVKVLKNNIGRLIVKDGSLGDEAKEIMDSVVGPTLIAFAYKDAAATAKALHAFSKENEALKLKVSLMGKKKISSDEVEQLASLPSREVLLSKLLATMNAPVSNFVGVLAAVPRSLLNVLVAIEKKKS